MPDSKMQRFSQRARRVLRLAQEAAEYLGHRTIGPEHLLLGLREEEGGVAGRVLWHLGLKVDDLERIIEHMGPADADERSSSQLDLSPKTKKILELSVEEARQMDHHYIGTEHLLLALLKHNDRSTMNILSELNVSPDAIRKLIYQVLQDNDSIPAPPPTARRQRPPRPRTARPSPRPPAEIQHFTQPARRVLSLAHERAEQMRHTEIDTEHLLLGLLLEDGGGAGRVMQQLGIEAPAVEQIVRRMRPTGERQRSTKLDLAPDTKRIIELAVEEARQMGHDHMGTEHLLLALLRHNQGIALNVLKELDISPAEIRERTHNFLRGL